MDGDLYPKFELRTWIEVTKRISGASVGVRLTTMFLGLALISIAVVGILGYQRSIRVNGSNWIPNQN